MNTILMAMTRDLIHRCRWNFLMFASIANLLPLLLFVALRSEGLAANDAHLKVMLYRLMTLNSFFCAASLIDNHPFSSRLFVAPASSAKLFFYMLLPQMLIAGGGTWLLVTMQNWCTSQDFPAWSAALVSSCGVAICWSTHWMTYRSAWQAVAFAITTGGLVGWYVSRFLWMQPSEPIPDLSSFEWLALCVVTILFSCMGYRGFARVRCGEGFGSQRALSISSQRPQWQAVHPKRFSTPFAAQLWFEWRSKGWTLPLFVSVGIMVGVVTWTLRSRDPDELFRGLIVSGYLLSALGALLGLLAYGNYGFSWSTGNQKSDFELGHFLASRPITNATLAYANLLSLGKSVLIAWAIWGVSLLVSYSLVLDARSLEVSTFTWWFLPTTLVLLWTTTTTLTSVAVTGELQRFGPGIVSIIVGASFAMILSNKWLEPDLKARLFQLTHMACVSGAVAGSFWLFKLARRRQLISKTMAINCAWIWLLFVAAIAFEACRGVSHPISIHVTAIGVASLAVVSVAASPLAFARNRTR
ncbi:hypothetical protein [Schlesneria paludicola]|uniref:hypothetical protein n=1 Tax=Schlesneria paludicola TaxID=360056 RepID=UPI00029A565D|nr:hypothetical protein [Schlesneria paludicola]